MSMIFQSYAVWPHMTVYENIAYPLKLKKRPKAEIAETVKRVARICEIDGNLNRHPAQLSGGQRQRVAVARAIAVPSKLFLMDEPLSNLDAKLRVSVRTFLKQIHQEYNATTIFVTHDQSEAMARARL
jgi:multiple sugar transport system ATP-binding protein